MPYCATPSGGAQTGGNRGKRTGRGTPRGREYPDPWAIAAATNTYMGGHEYTVDDATKAALIAAGVGVSESNFTAQ